MVPARQTAAGVPAAGGCTVLAVTAIMLAACGGQHTVTPATTSPAASSPSAHSSSAAAATGSVQLPAQLLGLKKNTSATVKQSIPIVSRQFASPLTEEVVGGKAAIYGGQNDATPIIFVSAGAWTEHVASPDNLARTLQVFMLTKGFTNARVLPPGRDGEALACGQRHIPPGTNSVCYWADHVSFGVVVYSPGFVSSLRDAASKTSQIRSTVVG